VALAKGGMMALFRGRYRILWSIVASAWLAGCPGALDGPVPQVADPAPSTPLPVDPGIVCGDQLTTPVTLSGERFSPMPFDIPDDPRAELPTVTVVRARAIDGGPSDGAEERWSGTPGGLNAALLSWRSQAQMTFVVNPTLERQDGSVGRLAAALYDVRVTNANGHAATSEASLGVVDRPTLASTSPGITCLAEGSRTIGLAGASLLRLDGREPALEVEGVASPFALSAFDPCTPIPHPGVDAELCDAAAAVLAQDSVPVGFPRLTLHNPETAACVSEEETRLRVVPPPAIDSIRPPLVCVAQGPRDVTLVGRDILRIDGAFPDVTLDGAPISTVALAECQALETQGHEVQRCDELVVTIPEEATEAPREPTLVLTNPAPAGCADTAFDQLVLVPPPHIDDVQPPVLCAGAGTQTLRLTGRDFLVVEGAPPEVTVDSTTLPAAAVTPSSCAPLSVPGLTVERCEVIDIAVSPAMVEGDAAIVSLVNPAPAGCGATYAIPVPLIDPPLVEAVAPALVCTDDGARELVITGSNFYVVDGVLPTVTLDGHDAPVSAADDCEATAIGPLEDVAVCGALTVTAPMGSLAPGTVTVRVTSAPPIPCAGDADDQLVAPPHLAVTSATPASVCTASGDTVVTIEGEGFLIVDGAIPTLTLGGEAFPILPASLSGCVDLGAPGMAAESCQAFQVLVPAGTLSEGDVPVGVTNPAPSGCGAVQTDVFFSVPVPVLTSVAPTSFCTDTEDALTLTGSNFSPASTVFLTGEAGDTHHAAVTFVDATELVATFPADIPPGVYDITVENAAGCADTLVDEITVHPTPLVFFVDPPVVFNGITIAATIYLSGLDAEADSVEMLGPSGQEVLLSTSSPDGQPNRVNAVIPEGLEPGAWAVRVTSQIGCVGVLDGAVLVTDTVSVSVTDVSPDFVWYGASTAITVLSAPGDFLMTPRAYLNPVDAAPGTPATNVRATLFEDATTLTGVVPGGLLQGGTAYDLIVVNPDATVGIYSSVTVTEDPPPAIEAVVPASFATNAPFPATIEGAHFDVASVTMRCLVPSGADFVLFPPEGEPGLPVTVDLANATDTSVPAVFPSNHASLAEKSVCTVTLTNQDGSSFRFSAVSLKNAAQNLGAWRDTGRALIEARRGLGLVAGRPTNATRTLYAIGGDDGTSGGAKASVESASVDIFGRLGAWTLQRNALPAPRAFAGAVRVDRFVYVIGGDDGAAATGSVLRAEILDPLATPEFVDLLITLDDSEAAAGMGPGVWIYRIAATFPSDDPNNPGGESLPGEPIVVQLPDLEGLVLSVTWDAIPGATGYRVYRTPAADAGVDSVALVGTTTGGGATTFTDAGAEAGAETPLRFGSLGVWHEVGAGLNTPRQAHALVPAPHPTDDDLWVLYAAGGRGESAASAAPMASYEYSVLEVSPPALAKDRQLQTLTPWTELPAQLGVARSDLSGFVLTQRDLVAGAARGNVWVVFGPGRTAAGATNRMDAGVVHADGTLGYPADDPRGATDPPLMLPAGTPPAYLGYGAGMANSRLFVVGGGGAATSPDNRVHDGVLCVGVSGTAGCGAGGGALPDVGNWTPQGSGVLSGARIFLGVTQESAFFFAAGGMGPAAGGGLEARTQVDTTVQ